MPKDSDADSLCRLKLSFQGNAEGGMLLNWAEVMSTLLNTTGNHWANVALPWEKKVAGVLRGGLGIDWC